jgi:hypothetical protein
LFLLPILLLVLLAGVELGAITSAGQKLSAASAHGARIAAQGGDEADVERAVRRALGSGKLSRAKVIPMLRDEHGNLLESGDSVEVRVEIPAREASMDLLGSIGFRLQGENLSARSVMRKE